MRAGCGLFHSIAAWALPWAAAVLFWVTFERCFYQQFLQLTRMAAAFSPVT